jgi:hypothetical protein
VQLAALDLVQNGLAGDAEPLRGLVERKIAARHLRVLAELIRKWRSTSAWRASRDSL